MDEPVRKKHRERQSGTKADKKKATKRKNEDKRNDPSRNPKAFSIQSAKKAARMVQRTADIQAKKQHVPSVDRTPLEPPPILVVVVGPPKVGKSTLVRGLLKNWTRQNVGEIRGPITVVSGKKRRVTLVECPNDMSAMIDVAKVADLVRNCDVLYVCVSVYLCVHVSVHLYVHVSVHLYVRVSVYLSVCVCTYLFLSVCLSVCPGSKILQILVFARAIKRKDTPT